MLIGPAVLGVDPGEDEDVAFVKLRNAGVNIALSRDIALGEDCTVTIGVRQNIPLRNGGYDTTISIGLRWGFPQEERAAW